MCLLRTNTNKCNQCQAQMYCTQMKMDHLICRETTKQANSGCVFILHIMGNENISVICRTNICNIYIFLALHNINLFALSSLASPDH